MAEWQERISINPSVCHRRACIRGTRVMVSVILDNIAAGVPYAEIMRSYPSIQESDIQATLAYAAELVRRAPSIRGSSHRPAD
jgi:uncharacterized protein (DUF433 family)